MKIILGITGSIAAYKSVYLTRLCIQSGHEVKVVMTDSAKAFVSPLTFSTLSKHPVNSQMFDTQSGEWTNHVFLALWADVIVIAPATANTLAKLTIGLCDNLLLAVCLSSVCKIFVAPAMDRDMFLNAATQQNLQVLASRGIMIIPPGIGELASGLEGPGRMAEPEDIMTFITNN